MPDDEIVPRESHRYLKKERTRARILENAIALFRDSGVHATKTVDIAAASDVSPATLFNYYPSKGHLAEAWVRGEIRDELAALAAPSEDRGLRASLRGRCRALAEASCPERELRLEAWRSAGRWADSALGVSKRLEGRIAREQNRGRLRRDLTAESLCGAVIEAIEGGLIAGLRDSRDPGQVAAVLRQRIDLVLDGARKRNERVAPPPSVRPPSGPVAPGGR